MNRVCQICGNPFAVGYPPNYPESFLLKELENHILWNHPEEQDVIDLYHDIDLKLVKIQNLYHAGDYVQASLLLGEISTDALRFKKYIDIKLGEV